MATSIDSTYVQPDDDGVVIPHSSPVTVDTTEGNTFTNDGQIMLSVTNGSGGSADLTIEFPANLDAGGVAHPDKTVTMAASETRVFQLDPQIYGRDPVVQAPSGFTFYLIR